MRGLNWLKPPPPPEVRDDPEAERFVISVDGRRAGYAAYHRSPGEITFTHTEIEPEFEGKGLGSILIREMLARARANGDAVIPRCPFVRSYIERHPPELELVPQQRRAEFNLLTRSDAPERMPGSRRSI
jgi:predicted GNAT family acetyltransferase